jgi:hypothetical protein
MFPECMTPERKLLEALREFAAARGYELAPLTADATLEIPVVPVGIPRPGDFALLRIPVIELAVMAETGR